ncbi:MAG: acyl-CoA thioesterase [Bacteroidales bacterium]|nr:acyl-CoA thioesterase [Bacteroidales bacterium]
MAIDKTKTYQYHLEARGYELDSYDHVNNAVYLNYLEQARWSLFRETGLLHYFKESGKKIVVIELNIRYMKEIRLFDKVVVETKVTKEMPYLIFNHRILKATTRIPLARAKAKTLFLDENKTPVDIPAKILINEKVQ